MKKHPAYFCLLCGILFLNCKKNPIQDVPVFEKVPATFSVIPGVIDEASGIADSYAHTGYLWVHEDSGNDPVLHLLDHKGKHGNKVVIADAINRDWEDIAIANGPVANLHYVYIGDIGDNNAIYPTCSIYRLTEPPMGTDTVHSFEKIVFQYSDGPRDAEALLVDNLSKDIFIITKRDASSKVYKLAYPQNVNSLNVAQHVQDLKFNGVVSAACAPDGKAIILKTYFSVLYYVRKSGQSIVQALQNEPYTLPYQMEPQGEAITFAINNKGFYTLSEKALAPSVSLNFYKRN